MSLFRKLLEEQGALIEQRPNFLPSFDPHRTASLVDVLTSDAAVARIGLSDALDRVRLRSLLVHYCDFLSRLPARPDSLCGGRLIFFQCGNIEEDRQNPDPRPDFERQPHASRYFHTRTNFDERTLGSWELGNRVIRPGCSFSNRDWKGLYPSDPGYKVKSGQVVGYRFPDMAKALRVSRACATDYVARVVIHDLGHAVLPDISGMREPLHDVAMVYAMNAAQSYPRTFEGLVRRECTDPFFFLDAPEFLEKIGTKGLDSTQRRYHEDLVAKYEPEVLCNQWAPLFELDESVEIEAAKSHIRSILVDMRLTGFERYKQAA